MLNPGRKFHILIDTIPLAVMMFLGLQGSQLGLCSPDKTKTGTASVKTEKVVKKDKATKPCVPQLAPGPSHGPSKELKFRKGETYRHSPVVSYQVDPDGTVSNVKLIRSTGVKDIDAFAVEWVKQLKYKPAPGCETLLTEVDITIDFRE